MKDLYPPENNNPECYLTEKDVESIDIFTLDVYLNRSQFKFFYKLAYRMRCKDSDLMLAIALGAIASWSKHEEDTMLVNFLDDLRRYADNGEVPA